MKKKTIIIGGVAIAACLTAGLIFGGFETEETTYREVAVEYGTLVVGITESGAVDIGTVDQIFELDMSALQRVTTENGSSSGSSNMGNAMGGGTPGGGAGAGMDMFSQIFNMAGDNSATQESSDSQLIIGEVCVAIGQQVQEGDTLYILEESGVNELTQELSGNVDLAKTDLDALIADQELSKKIAEYTYEISTEYGDYAETERSLTIQQLQDAVTEKQELLTAAKETLATYQENLSQAKSDLEKAEAALEALEWSRDNTNKDTELYLYTQYFTDAEEYQSVVDTLLQKVEQLEENISRAESNVESYEQEIASAKRELASGQLSAENTYELRVLAYENAQETYDITLAYLEEDLLAQQEVYEEAESKWAEFSSHISGNEVQAKYNGVITSVGLAQGDSLTTGATVVTLYDAEDVSMTVSLEEEDMTAIQVGGMANITFTAYPETVYKAEITEISDGETDSSGTTTYDVTVTLQGDVSGLFQGMTGEITFITKESKEVLHVSNRAIIRDGKKSYVKVKDASGNVKKVEVVTGFSDGVSVEIIDGLQEGDIVLVESKVSES
ncbi:MAG: efflux RND transporter periplasmic adaptor subunit [Lachnospiraceae bacterium]|nr:efflux RND transporter periplasmic adaptor subunit [Lachnospiraceae bacterium]